MTDIEDEVDFEIDPEDLDSAPVVAVPSEQLSLLVNDLHVTYRVFGAKKVGHGPQRKQGFWSRSCSGAERASPRSVR